MSEKTTSEFMLDIASHYLMNGCDDCPFYNVTKTCDSKPINCTWMALRNYFKTEESKEESESTEPERKWIPVNEALPEEDIDVLLQFPHTMAVGYQEDGFWNIVTCDDLYSGLDEEDEKPIAWQPLPEPYRGEK